MDQEKAGGSNFMKTHEFTIADQTWHLCLNGTALLNAYEKFGDKESLISHLEGTSKASFEATCCFLAELATQGELVRRYQGHNHGKIPTEQMFRVILAPLDIAPAKNAVRVALALGFRREVDDGQPVDLGLLELEKKTVLG